jgi:intraflagellar transport protein 88
MQIAANTCVFASADLLQLPLQLLVLLCAAALEKALDAGKKERQLAKFRESAGQADNHPPELGFAVELQLASCYAASKLYGEALELYGALVKSKNLPVQAGR